MTYSVRVANDVGICESTDVLNEGFHLVSTQGTVKTKSHGVRVLEGRNKGFSGLTRQGTTTLIYNSSRDEDGNLWTTVNRV
jgi:hypothetical protein